MTSSAALPSCSRQTPSRPRSASPSTPHESQRLGRPRPASLQDHRQHLVSNAIKFSPSRHGDPFCNQRHTVCLRSRDSGSRPGPRKIPEDKLTESIFERFHQVDRLRLQNHGVAPASGLAICAPSSPSMEAASGPPAPRQRLTFHFTLPTRPASNLL